MSHIVKYRWIPTTFSNNYGGAWWNGLIVLPFNYFRKTSPLGSKTKGQNTKQVLLGVLYFLVTPSMNFTILPYYWRTDL